MAFSDTFARHVKNASAAMHATPRYAFGAAREVTPRGARPCIVSPSVVMSRTIRRPYSAA
jgi:hypothetical protein